MVSSSQMIEMAMPPVEEENFFEIRWAMFFYNDLGNQMEALPFLRVEESVGKVQAFLAIGTFIGLCRFELQIKWFSIPIG